MRAAAMRAWAWLTWLESPVVIVRRSTMHRNERNAFNLGVDAGALGQVAPSPAASRVVQLTGLPSGVVGFEIPPAESVSP